MALDQVFLQKYQNDDWFKSHSAALAIIKDGRQQIASTKPAIYNLQCLLSNMCEYGRRRWRYEPGNNVNVEATLKGNTMVTDCESLAKIFCEIAIHLGYLGIQPHKIQKNGYRIVTKTGIVAINGRTGDSSLEGRWCFGDHWVALYQNMCYDPTFNFKEFSIAQIPIVYLGWYAQEVHNPEFFTGTYWKADPTVRDSRDVYMRGVPDVAYTFKPTERKKGREL